ncbi:MAG: FMN-binding protein [Treponema sp.]
MQKSFILFVSLVFLFSCTKKEEAVNESSNYYIDGTYKATSSIKDEWGGTATVEIVVRDGRITSCIFTSYEEDGKLKDAEYGKTDGIIKNMGLYKIAQNAVVQSNKYGDMLVKTQDIESLDALSGATVSFDLFKNAVEQIMKEAKIPECQSGLIDKYDSFRG